MNGTMGVNSDFGHGSTFWFILPFSIVAPNPSVQPAGPDTDPADVHVLVLSGQEMQRDILCRQLVAWKFKNIAAASAEEAGKRLDEFSESINPIRVVLVDAGLSESERATFARRLQSHPASNYTVLLLTPVEAPVKAEALKAAGYAAQVPKPVCQSQLFDRIMDAMGARRPAVQNALTCQAARPPNQAVARKVGTRILLVEDNLVNQKVAAKYLERAGYDYDIVGNGQKALETVCGGNHYELVLMDCQMPLMDGFQTTEAIRQAEADGRLKHPWSSRVPIIALTANAVMGDRERCLAAGMDDYLSKPLNPATMVKTIEETLDRLALTPRHSSESPLQPGYAGDWCGGRCESARRQFRRFATGAGL